MKENITIPPYLVYEWEIYLKEKQYLGIDGIMVKWSVSKFVPERYWFLSNSLNNLYIANIKEQFDSCGFVQQFALLMRRFLHSGLSWQVLLLFSDSAFYLDMVGLLQNGFFDPRCELPVFRHKRQHDHEQDQGPPNARRFSCMFATSLM
ncbi:MAG: hypothetical protein ACE5HO_18045 [bacterium]